MLHRSSSRLATFMFAIAFALASCSAATESAYKAGDSAVSVAEADQANEVNQSSAATEGKVADSAAPNSPRVQPQLIKTATLDLDVETVEDTIEELTQILRQQQGDILDLNYEQSDAENMSQFASLQVRVPQANLDATLKKFGALGTIARQNITAEDVSDQLVDLDARLRNLRKAEESILKILDRAGSMNDVLTVSRELRTIRQEIEQIAAQQKNLQNRVAYSTINVQLEAIAPLVSTRDPLGNQFNETWQVATRSLQDFTVFMLRFLLWLLVWSPYWGIILLGIFFGMKWRKRANANDNAL